MNFEGRKTLKRKPYWTIFFKIRAKIEEKKHLFCVILRNEFYRLSVQINESRLSSSLLTYFLGVYIWAMTQFAWYGSSSFKTFLNNVSRQKLHEKILTFLRGGGVGDWLCFCCCFIFFFIILSFLGFFSPYFYCWQAPNLSSVIHVILVQLKTGQCHEKVDTFLSPDRAKKTLIDLQQIKVNE